MSRTIDESVKQLHKSLVEYIEATYHISNQPLIKQRRDILNGKSTIKQDPYIESTPRYSSKRRYAEIPNLNQHAVKLLESLARGNGNKPLIFDPPYEHQAEAIEATICGERKSIIIMTGTGSGKTESFLLPILSKLAVEASSNQQSFQKKGMRALILYPMNALVNDQLGRLRTFFSDSDLKNLFKEWSGRVPTFARYTSRTPYAGIRTSAKDGTRLKPFRDFYVKQLQLSREGDSPEGRAARKLIDDLVTKGKWPAKPDLEAWYGEDNTPRKKRGTETYKRAITLPDDSELLTRHEVQDNVPDLLVTNYSMLEYMMMRPIERPIFEQTRQWLEENPAEKFLIVLDEAHLYRGAAGAEVGHLLRRLRDRLNIPIERFQVICATASFSDQERAVSFASQLTGVPEASFCTPIVGSLDERKNAKSGTEAEAKMLASINLDQFYEADLSSRQTAILPLLNYRNVDSTNSIEQDLHTALKDFGPLSKLVNITMGKAYPIEKIGRELFPHCDDQLAATAASTLASLASTARETEHASSLFPCRVHNFFRGLHGLWVCMDKNCTAIDVNTANVAGKLYSQHRDSCECGARVLPLYTCRHCGTAYARGYVENISDPKTVWAFPGLPLRTEGEISPTLSPIDILLETPEEDADSECLAYDLDIGQFGSVSSRSRSVYIKGTRNAVSPKKLEDDDDEEEEGPVVRDGSGVFKPCAVCNKHGHMGRAPVQDHETKGDQPFQVLVTRQLTMQPPGPQPETLFAPLRGRKVLVFSDSRQVAARLAPNLQMYAARDTLRALIVRGYEHIQKIPDYSASLDDIYAAVLVAAAELGVRLRPELHPGETFYLEKVRAAVKKGGEGFFADYGKLRDLCYQIGREKPPESLFTDIYEAFRDRARGLEALAIGSIVEKAEKREDIYSLPNIPGTATTNLEKLELVRAWIRCWHFKGVHIHGSPGKWYDGEAKNRRVKSSAGEFKKRMQKLIQSSGSWKIFKANWLPYLRNNLTDHMGGNAYRLRGRELSFEFGGTWVRCTKCKAVHRPLGTLKVCQECGSSTLIDLDVAQDDSFLTRKGYYRNAVLRTDEPPVSLVAAEHTAQLNSSQVEGVFSKAEQHELLFQDVELPTDNTSTPSTSIDVLSSTTTMEVGIDIGQLSGVALRNMPPARANYQQRAGRAGRRGNAIATVIAYGGSDSHDEHYFSNPQEMISGQVIDPTLSLDKIGIAKRHINAFLLQNYHMSRLPEGTGDADLFSVLGTVSSFKGNGTLNIRDFENWLTENEASLAVRLKDWLPDKLSQDDRNTLLATMVKTTISEIKTALDEHPQDNKEGAAHSTDHSKKVKQEDEQQEVAPESGEEKPAEHLDKSKLLDWLLFKAVLPRYAFPTDVATFFVFDYEKSSSAWPVPRFAPGQGLPIALSQYAPGKQVWISGKCYTSGALYSPNLKDLFSAWNDRKLYLSCRVCGYSSLESRESDLKIGTSISCGACGSKDSVGPIRHWLRPPGFAHPITEPEVTSPDDMPESSYATRAQLTMASPPNGSWSEVTHKIRYFGLQDKLLVSNSGPGKEGYRYCTSCGRIESETAHDKKLIGTHDKPFDKDKRCEFNATRNLVLGTEFVTDIALFSLRLSAPFQLLPTSSVTSIALRTLCEAIARAATLLLEIEPGEIMAEYRPALTSAGVAGSEAEIFLYDTLPGGAGFSQSAAAKGRELFEKALEIMTSCKDNCDAGCYRCLWTFRNRIEHSTIDRHVGASLLKYLLSDDMDGYASTRISKSEHLLYVALSRTPLNGSKLEQDVMFTTSAGHSVRVPIVITKPNGRRLLLALSNPLCEGTPTDSGLEASVVGELGLFRVINELLVRKNTPAAIAQALNHLQST